MESGHMKLMIGVFVSLLAAGAAHAESGCVIEQAAQAALDRQVKAIEAAQTDVGSFFSGSNSCINSNLLQMIDFSNVIPDLAGLVSSLGTEAINNMLNSAIAQACEVANEQIADVTGNLNSSLTSWNSNLSDEIGSIISDGQISLP
jgi:phage-related minor tail protein